MLISDAIEKRKILKCTKKILENNDVNFLIDFLASYACSDYRKYIDIESLEYYLLSKASSSDLKILFDRNCLNKDDEVLIQGLIIRKDAEKLANICDSALKIYGLNDEIFSVVYANGSFEDLQKYHSNMLKFRYMPEVSDNLQKIRERIAEISKEQPEKQSQVKDFVVK